MPHALARKSKNEREKSAQQCCKSAQELRKKLSRKVSNIYCSK
jgi:hypothetical protein